MHVLSPVLLLPYGVPSVPFFIIFSMKCLCVCFLDFIKRFNPDVLGWSIETGGPRSSKSYLNNAVVGAIAK